MQEEKFNKQYDRWGVERPSHNEHGTPEDIRDKMEAAQATSWRLEGNRLTADTQHGAVTQFIPPNYICLGIDGKGLPILQKIGMN